MPLARPVRPAIGVRLVVAVLAVVVAGCGSGSADPSADGVIRVIGTDTLRFEPDELEATAGTLTFELVCEPGANHNLVIDETGRQVAACAPGRTARGSTELVAGTYVYVCTVPGHEVTMRGTLRVS